MWGAAPSLRPKSACVNPSLPTAGGMASASVQLQHDHRVHRQRRDVDEEFVAFAAGPEVLVLGLEVDALDVEAGDAQADAGDGDGFFAQGDVILGGAVVAGRV